MSNAQLRKKVKRFIDEADDHVVKMVFALLEADRNYDWWEDLPSAIKKGILKAEKELKAGKGIPHEVVMKKYSKFFAR